MSSDFRAPPKSDVKGWAVVAALTRASLPYFRIYEDLPLADLGHPHACKKGSSAPDAVDVTP